MPHVELSLTDTPVPRHSHPVADSSLGRWATAVTEANEACLVLAADATIVAISASAAELIGLGEPGSAPGQTLQEAADPLVDFTAARAPLDEVEASKIPPLLAISSGRIARGLIRLLSRSTGRATTFDAVSTPLTEDDAVVGSLTFLARV